MMPLQMRSSQRTCSRAQNMKHTIDKREKREAVSQTNPFSRRRDFHGMRRINEYPPFDDGADDGGDCSTFACKQAVARVVC